MLPVTALAVGCGVADPIVASTSLDCTCSIRSLATGRSEQGISYAVHRISIFTSMPTVTDTLTSCFDVELLMREGTYLLGSCRASCSQTSFRHVTGLASS